MNKNELKELFLKAKNFFSEETPPVETPAPVIELKDVKGKDGKVYKVSALEVGGTIESIDEAGIATPAADGEIELEDGAKIVVAEGKITEVKPKEEEAPKEAPKEESAAPTFNAEDFVAKNVFDALQNSFNELKGKFESLTASAAIQKDAFKALFDAVEILSGEPTATATEAPKSDAFKKVQAKGKADRRERFASAIAKMNNN